MTLFTDRDERVIENLRIINSRFIRKKKAVVRGERPSPFGKGGGAPTVVVAAVGSTQFSKDRADFQCTGLNDQVIIQAALDVCTSTGGLVWLCEGVYFCEIPTTGPAITIPPTVTLTGLGPGWDGGTMLEMSNVSDPGRQPLIEMDHHTEIRNLTIYTFDSAVGVRLKANQAVIKIRDCWIETRNSACIEGSGSNHLIWIERNICWVSDDPITEVDSVIHLDGDNVTDVWIERNYLLNGWHGIFFDGDAGRNHLNHNYLLGNWFSGIRLKDDVNPIFATTILGNLIQAPGIGSDGSTGEAGIYISADGADIDPTTAQSNGLIIADNIIEVTTTNYGIRLTDCCLVDVHDNYIEQQGLHGIYLEDANSNQIHDNTIQEPNTFPALTYDGIFLVTSDDNYIRMNTLIEHRGGSPTYFRYAINVSNAGSNRNIVVGNDLRLAGSGTGFINDAGTGTLMTWPAGGAGIGDNWT